MTPSGSPPSSMRGFTLLELLVSLTVLGAILALLAGGLRVLAKNWDINSDRLEALDMVSRAFDIFQRDAENLLRFTTARQGETGFGFAGSPEQLSFIALEPPFPTRSGPYFLDYSIDRNGPLTTLIRARAPYRTGMAKFPGASPANRVPLIEGGFRYVFAYGEATGRGIDWRKDWLHSRRLPDLLRLRILSGDTDAPVIPDMIVRIRATAELACISGDEELCTAMKGVDRPVRDTRKSPQKEAQKQ